MIGKPQTLWDARAALNFMLGGTGSGLMVAALFFPSREAFLIGTALVLVAGGLGAVWLEIGRKLRAVHVFFNPFTSWMSREALAAVVLFGLGILALVSRNQELAYMAGAAAAAFLYCQARILLAAKGIPAWRAPEVVPLIVSTGLAEGSGLALLFGAPPPLYVFFGLVVMARAFAWQRYRAAVRAPQLQSAGTVLLRLGSAVALAAAALAWVAPALAPFAAPIAAAAALAAGWNLKLRLLTRAAIRQDFTLPHLPVRGTR